MNTSFATHHLKELIYLTIPSFDATALVKHCFTTRRGGVSTDIYDSLNTSLVKSDTRENVLTNLDIVCSAVGIDYRKLVLSDQTHGDQVRAITEEDIGKGIMRESDIKAVDALITNVPGVPLITFYADCVPVYILDPVKKAIGLVHSGWKGTTMKIAVKAIEKMSEVYGTKPEDCLIGIGPSIEMNCFEIKEDTASIFMRSFENWRLFMKQKDEEHYIADLWMAIVLMLREAGVQDQNITVSGLCTCCSQDLFFSHRRDRGKTGSLSAILELKSY